MTRLFCIIVASGRGTRFHESLPKQYAKLTEHETVLDYCIRAWCSVPNVHTIFVVVSEDAWAQYPHLKKPKVEYILGGKERVHSVYAGLTSLLPHCDPMDYVYVHDAARPLFSLNDVARLTEVVAEHPVGGILVSRLSDTLKKKIGEDSLSTVVREGYLLALTPQLFRVGILYEALGTALSQNKIPTDEGQALEWVGHRYLSVVAEMHPHKITYPEDILILRSRIMQNRVAQPQIRIGHGYDIHRLQAGQGLKLGGHFIECPYEVLAHSDGDVVIHALCDALLGAAALGDIGRLFPDNDPKYRGTDSRYFLEEVTALLHKNGYTVINIDVTIQAETPKVSPHAQKMTEVLSELLSVPKSAISIKAKTMEQLGPIGAREAIAAHVVALIVRAAEVAL